MQQKREMYYRYVRSLVEFLIIMTFISIVSNIYDMFFIKKENVADEILSRMNTFESFVMMVIYGLLYYWLRFLK